MNNPEQCDPKPESKEQVRSKQSRIPPETADLFVLDSAFPDPLKYLSSFAPAVSSLAKDCAFAFDANALIALYRLSAKTVDQIKGTLKGLADQRRLFVPRRALQECLKNRSVVLRDLYTSVCQIESQNQSPALPRIPMLERHTEYEEVSKQIELVAKPRKELAKAIAALKQSLQNWAWDDPVSRMLSEVLSPECVITSQLSNEQIAADNRRRIRCELPPGYKDSGKADLGVGDVIIWHSLIELGQSTGRHVLFVSNDEKPDWVVSANKDSLVARPELCGEFLEVTGRYFGILRLSRMMELIEVSAEAIKSIQQAEIDSEGTSSPPDIMLALAASSNSLRALCQSMDDPVRSGVLCAEYLAHRSRFRALFDEATKQYPHAALPLDSARRVTGRVAGMISSFYDPWSNVCTPVAVDERNALHRESDGLSRELMNLVALIG